MNRLSHLDFLLSAKRNVSAIPETPDRRQFAIFFTAETMLIKPAIVSAFATTMYLLLTVVLNVVHVESPVPWGWGLFLSSAGLWVLAGILGALHFLMESKPSDEMLRWLKRHRERVGTDDWKIPLTKREFAPYVQEHYFHMASAMERFQ